MPGKMSAEEVRIKLRKDLAAHRLETYSGGDDGRLSLRPDSGNFIEDICHVRTPGGSMMRAEGVDFAAVQLLRDGTPRILLSGPIRDVTLRFVDGSTVVVTKLYRGGARFTQTLSRIDGPGGHDFLRGFLDEIVEWVKSGGKP